MNTPDVGPLNTASEIPLGAGLWFGVVHLCSHTIGPDSDEAVGRGVLEHMATCPDLPAAG